MRPLHDHGGQEDEPDDDDREMLAGSNAVNPQ
jgi:hypothetical protein